MPGPPQVGAGWIRTAKQLADFGIRNPQLPDHTCYTLSTAGSEGALNLLPIYADHILFPTITDSGSGFKTEIRHITGKGEGMQKRGRVGDF